MRHHLYDWETESIIFTYSDVYRNLRVFSLTPFAKWKRNVKQHAYVCGGIYGLSGDGYYINKKWHSIPMTMFGNCKNEYLRFGRRYSIMDELFRIVPVETLEQMTVEAYEKLRIFYFPVYFKENMNRRKNHMNFAVRSVSGEKVVLNDKCSFTSFRSLKYDCFASFVFRKDSVPGIHYNKWSGGCGFRAKMKTLSEKKGSVGGPDEILNDLFESFDSEESGIGKVEVKLVRSFRTGGRYIPDVYDDIPKGNYGNANWKNFGKKRKQWMKKIRKGMEYSDYRSRGVISVSKNKVSGYESSYESSEEYLFAETCDGFEEYEYSTASE